MIALVLAILAVAVAILAFLKAKKLKTEVDVLGQTLVNLIEQQNQGKAPQPPTRSTERQIRDSMESHLQKYHRGQQT